MAVDHCITIWGVNICEFGKTISSASLNKLVARSHLARGVAYGQQEGECLLVSFRVGLSKLLLNIHMIALYNF